MYCKVAEVSANSVLLMLCNFSNRNGCHVIFYCLLFSPKYTFDASSKEEFSAETNYFSAEYVLFTLRVCRKARSRMPEGLLARAVGL